MYHHQCIANCREQSLHEHDPHRKADSAADLDLRYRNLFRTLHFMPAVTAVFFYTNHCNLRSHIHHSIGFYVTCPPIHRVDHEHPGRTLAFFPWIDAARAGS